MSELKNGEGYFLLATRQGKLSALCWLGKFCLNNSCFLVVLCVVSVFQLSDKQQNT
jgi:hypothetical protein